MSEENVEIVRRVLDGFSRLDRASVEPLLHPDVEWRTVLGPLLGVATVSGRDAMLRFAFEEIPDEDWLRFFEVNVLSGVRLSRFYLPGMLQKDWGRVVFISSESGVNIPVEMIQ